MSDCRLDDLRDVPQHGAAVADRIWNTWWKPDGLPLSAVEAALDEICLARDFPFTLVAHADGQFLGTATAIMTDIQERPQLGPCLAALWVEEHARSRGVGGALMQAALARLSALGHPAAFLSAKPHMRHFYLQHGWTLVESDVGEERLDVFRSALP